jgi:hypothetical protein
MPLLLGFLQHMECNHQVNIRPHLHISGSTRVARVCSSNLGLEEAFARRVILQPAACVSLNLLEPAEATSTVDLLVTDSIKPASLSGETGARAITPMPPAGPAWRPSCSAHRTVSKPCEYDATNCQ